MVANVMSAGREEMSRWLTGDHLAIPALPSVAKCRYYHYYLNDSHIEKNNSRQIARMQWPLVVILQQMGLMEEPNLLWPEISSLFGGGNQITIVLVGGTSLRRINGWRNVLEFVSEGSPPLRQILLDAIMIMMPPKMRWLLRFCHHLLKCLWRR